MGRERFEIFDKVLGMTKQSYIVEVEPSKLARDGKPSIGPVYRSIFAKDGFPAPLPGLDCCWDIFRLSVEKYPNNRMLGRLEIVNGKPDKYVWMTYKEVYDIVLKVGNSIRCCGIEKGGRCGIYGANSSEWIMSMEACNAHGLYCVPLYDTLGAGAIEFIICHAEVALAFVEEKKVSELLKTFPNAATHLKTIVSFGKVTSQQKEEAENFGVAIYSWDEFLSLVTCNDVYLSYLPLAHIFDRVIEECFINNGGSIGFWRGDVKLLVEDIGILKPTIFCAVPRVLERIYTGLQQKISAGGFVKHTMFNLAYSLKLRNMRKGRKHAEASPLCDKVVFSKIKQGLGGNVRVILSGAAPLASHVEEFLRVVSGLTETCAGTFVTIPDELSMLGTVGPPVPNVDVCLESVPEMGYDALSSTPRGEVCVRGDTLFSGYFKREDLTKEVFIDGWFHTGDIGQWQPDGSLKIVDRKKNIFKLSQGEYVAVENLENIYGLVPDIDSIWIYGNSFESCLVAVINPNQQAVERWAEQNGLSGDFNALCENPKVKEYFLGELSRIAKEKKLKGFEFVRAVHLDPVPFDMERDLITPTFKKKRPQMLKYYQSVIDNMYKSVK
ncbi:long chain acyl-coa synthetase 4 [Phtheirospermum japonicum]|uniref:Long chain acyl-coa synthetase 4 n=1 Tax=Phtheirospermum japonicum TaxID=374723 RepID=A0A830BRL6_9LAMI|nr:long chain acyl-coa synthetase 4 [Phtheirospermum japonicum]